MVSAIASVPSAVTKKGRPHTWRSGSKAAGAASRSRSTPRPHAFARKRTFAMRTASETSGSSASEGASPSTYG